MENSRPDLTSWELLAYYEKQEAKRLSLQEWEDQGENKVYNLELPFIYASCSRAFIDTESSDPSIERFLAESQRDFGLLGSYTERIIKNAIRLGLHGSLKEHHKNRTAVTSILKQAFADNWASQYKSESEKVVVSAIIERVREKALGYK